MVPACLLAQDSFPTAITINNRTGDLPYSAQIGSQFEHVELSSGNLIVEVPFVSVPGRGMSFNYGVRFDSAYWVVEYPSTQNAYWNPEQRNWLTSNTIGWTPTQPYMTYTMGQMSCINPDSPTQPAPNQPGDPPSTPMGERIDGVIFTDEQGSKHQFAVNLQSNGDCANGSYNFRNMAGPSLGQDGYWANGLNGPFIRPDGLTYAAGGTSGGTSYVNLGKYFLDYANMTDTRGNKQTVSPGMTDSAGRVPITQQVNGNQIVYTVHDSNGNAQTYTVNLTPISISTAYDYSWGNPGSPNIQEYSATRSTISSIVLPTGESYGFTYDSYGDVSKITLPTGGYVSYLWSNVQCNNMIHRAVVSRTVNDGTTSSTWSLNYPNTTGTTCTMTLTAPADPNGVSHQTAYTYDHSNGPALLTSVIYDPQGNGSYLRGFQMTYSPPVQLGGTFASTTLQQLLASVTTTLNAGPNGAGGTVSRKEFDYDVEAFEEQETDCTSVPEEWNCETESKNSQGLVPPVWDQMSRGNVTAIREYDWGTGTYGPLLRQTLRTYLADSVPGYGMTPSGTDTFGSVKYSGSNIVDKAVDETIYDGSTPCTGTGSIGAGGTYIPPPTCGANKVSETKIAYDNSNPATYGYHGETTSAGRWLNTTGGYMTTTYVHDGFGNLTQVTDPRTLPTTIGYADSFTSGAGTCSIASNASVYPTSVTDALNHTRQISYYGCTGKVASSRNPNDVAAGRMGTIYTYDSVGRTLSTTAPDGGSTQTTYLDVASPSSTSTHSMSASTLLVTMNQMDGLGRPIFNETVSDPEGAIYVEKSYDALGRGYQAWNPTRCNPLGSPLAPHGCTETTYGTSETFYDAIARPTSTVNTDGTSATVSYNGNATTVTDENQVTHTTWTDALGRLTKVQEGASGWMTYYFYDLLGNLTCVEQHGDQSGTGCSGSTPTGPSNAWRIRRFTYDSLSRLLTATNPEVGTTTYQYDADGNVLSKTNSHATINYSYDNGNRLWMKTYTDNTPTACYLYDTYGGAGVTGGGIGSMTAEWTQSAASCNSNAIPTSGVFSSRKITAFDPVGRIAQEQEAPLGSSGSAYTFQYTYDQMGNVLTSNNGLSAGTPLSFQFTYSAANRLSLAQTTSMPWAESANYPATLFRANSQTVSTYGAAYSPVGWANAEFGILSTNSSTSGIAKSRSYDIRLRDAAESDVAPNGVAAAPGTGVVTLSGTEQRACNTGVGSNAVVAGGGGSKTGAQPLFGGGGGLCTYVYDSGRLWLTVNNVSVSILYSQTSTLTTLAAALRTAINTTQNYPVTAGGTGVTVQLTAVSTGEATNYTISSSGQPDNTLFSTTSFSIDTSGGTLTGGANSNATALYGYTLQYDAGSRVKGYNDTVMGNWTFGYDPVNVLNRLTSGTSTSGPYAGGTLNWSYDAFGNRTSEIGSGNPNLPSTTVGIDNTNRLSSTPASPTGGSLLSYYDAGALTFDGTSSYLYDAEGRLCAAHTQSGTIGYIYDATGQRTATGTLASFACGATFTPTKQFLLGLGGEQVTELDGSNNWQHTNVYAGGGQLATYDSLGVHYSLTDWLGTKHVQALASGGLETTFVSLPFGNGPNNQGATEHRFTGKERDAESGLDYFGARYYASNLGRWMSPDWSAKAEPVPYAKLTDPQSLNLYSYVGENPLGNIDADGHQRRGEPSNGLGSMLDQYTGDSPYFEELRYNAELTQMAHYAVYSLLYEAQQKPAVGGASVTLAFERDNGVLDHVSMYVSDGADWLIYDPDGSYAQKHHAGSGDIVTSDDGASRSEWMTYQRQHGEGVLHSTLIYTYSLSPADAGKVIANANRSSDAGQNQQFFPCARTISTVISGVGPFQNVHPVSLAPASLELQVYPIPHVNESK